MITADSLDTDIHTYLKRHENKQLLRFVTVGSVDDGKSTLIGRLLYDTRGVYEDQLADARSGPDGQVDLARITDGLQAEREQGITIDVAYRYFTTRTRKFIIADTPGHVQYTRNMATGASTANVAIILIDARLGVLQQSRRHAYIASLLGIPNLVVAINKMDLRGYDQGVYEAIKADFTAFAKRLSFREVRFFPISALEGDNCVTTSPNTPWYDGGTILEYLETVDIDSDRNFDDFRFPVQIVLRPNLDYRGFAGQIASGTVRVGDTVTVLPSGKSSRVTAIDAYEDELPEAFTPQSVTLRLADEIDISRGDILVSGGHQPTVTRQFDASVVWMHEQPLDPAKTYLIKHTTRYVPVSVAAVRSKIDLETLQTVDADTLALNDIGRLTLTAHRPLVVDPYTRNRATGAFIIIDSLTNDTVAAGMIASDDGQGGVEATTGGQPRSGVSHAERHKRLGQTGASVWLTGLPASGKSSIAYALERRLFDLGYLPAVVDADDHGDAALFEHERQLPAAELGATAAASARAGLVTICAFGTRTAADRAAARTAATGRDGRLPTLEVHVATPADVCAQRDTRGLWSREDAAQYEPPTSPDLVVDGLDTDEAVAAIIALLRGRGILSR